MIAYRLWPSFAYFGVTGPIMFSSSGLTKNADRVFWFDFAPAVMLTATRINAITKHRPTSHSLVRIVRG